MAGEDPLVLVVIWVAAGDLTWKTSSVCAESASPPSLLAQCLAVGLELESKSHRSTVQIKLLVKLSSSAVTYYQKLDQNAQLPKLHQKYQSIKIKINANYLQHNCLKLLQSRINLAQPFWAAAAAACSSFNCNVTQNHDCYLVLQLHHIHISYLG